MEAGATTCVFMRMAGPCPFQAFGLYGIMKGFVLPHIYHYHGFSVLRCHTQSRQNVPKGCAAGVTLLLDEEYLL